MKSLVCKGNFVEAVTMSSRRLLPSGKALHFYHLLQLAFILIKGTKASLHLEEVNRWLLLEAH